MSEQLHNPSTVEPAGESMLWRKKSDGTLYEPEKREIRGSRGRFISKDRKKVLKDLFDSANDKNEIILVIPNNPTPTTPPKLPKDSEQEIDRVPEKAILGFKDRLSRIVHAGTALASVAAGSAHGFEAEQERFDLNGIGKKIGAAVMRLVRRGDQEAIAEHEVVRSSGTDSPLEQDNFATYSVTWPTDHDPSADYLNDDLFYSRYVAVTDAPVGSDEKESGSSDSDIVPLPLPDKNQESTIDRVRRRYRQNTSSNEKAHSSGHKPPRGAGESLDTRAGMTHKEHLKKTVTRGAISGVGAAALGLVVAGSLWGYTNHDQDKHLYNQPGYEWDISDGNIDPYPDSSDDTPQSTTDSKNVPATPEAASPATSTPTAISTETAGVATETAAAAVNSESTAIATEVSTETTEPVPPASTPVSESGETVASSTITSDAGTAAARGADAAQEKAVEVMESQKTVNPSGNTRQSQEKATHDIDTDAYEVIIWPKGSISDAIQDYAADKGIIISDERSFEIYECLLKEVGAEGFFEGDGIRTYWIKTGPYAGQVGVDEGAAPWAEDTQNFIDDQIGLPQNP